MNKQFLIRTLAALMLSVPALAQQYQAVPQAQVAQYAEAAILAISNADRLFCNDGRNNQSANSLELLVAGYGFGPDVNVSSIREVYVNADRNQPLIKLVTSGYGNRVELEIETNSERTAVLRLKKTNFRAGRVNVGTLDNPNVISSWIAYSTYDCRVEVN